VSFFRPRRIRSDTGRSTPRGVGGLGLPAGLEIVPGVVGPFLAILGLVVIAVISVNLFNGQLPVVGGGNHQPGASGGDGGPVKTPTPSNVVQTDPRADVPGSLLYVKDGNIWLQTGDEASQLTDGGLDSQPTWSPDGQSIYFIRTRPASGRFLINGLVKDFDLQIPTLQQMHADGTALKGILTGRYTVGSYVWSFFIQQPSIASNGTQAAVTTDGPIPTQSDIRIKFVNLNTGAISDPHLPEVGGLGQQDPSFSPDGRYVAYVKNAREGAKGAPSIVRYDTKTKAVRTLTGPGYIQPAWSPDGRYIAATKISATGTDIVVIDSQSRAEVLRLTDDGTSFQPLWSPAGNGIAFQKIDRGVIDLWYVNLVGAGPTWQVGTSIALTLAAGIDATSRESWFIPPDQLPKPTPTPIPSVGPSSPPASPEPS
jgi:WD40-like Beta Propeller Repeat